MASLALGFALSLKVATSAPLPSGGGACVTDAPKPGGADAACVLNGRCSSSSCVCKDGWTGPHCGSLDLEPAKLESGYRLQDQSSWGGTVVPDPDESGRYHLVAAKLVSKCGLKSWKTNSVIVHVVADAPTGPFVSPLDSQDDVLHPAFSHNPVLWEYRPGQYAMYQIGCGEGGVVPMDCKNGSTPGVYPKSRKPEIAAEAAGCDNPHWTGVSGLAGSPAGPFAAPRSLEVAQHAGINVSAVWHTGGAFTNPSLTHGPNGSVLLAYSAGLNRFPGRKHIGVAEGASWDGPFYDLTPYDPIFDLPLIESSEDPHIFRDDEGNFHLLAHTCSGASCTEGHWPYVSAHAFSRDGRAWAVADVPPYTREIEWEDGTVATVFARERPQLLLDADGAPLVLANGVQPGNASTPFFRDGYTGDWSYTHVQAVRRKAQPVSV